MDFYTYVYHIYLVITSWFTTKNNMNTFVIAREIHLKQADTFNPLEKFHVNFTHYKLLRV